MGILICKRDFYVSKELDHTYFKKGDEFLLLSTGKKEAVLKQRKGYLTFRYPVDEIDNIFSEIV